MRPGRDAPLAGHGKDERELWRGELVKVVGFALQAAAARDLSGVAAKGGGGTDG